MSQPYNRSAIIPAPIEPDKRLNNWWVENPWLIAANGKSLSGYERNRVFLNHGGKDFFDISGLTEADSKADGRGVVTIDFNHDGMEDLLVRHVGGGPVKVYENRFPKSNWLTVALRGTRSNSQGIGARLTAEVDGRKLVRELYPNNGFLGQNAAQVHFGLGKSEKIDKLTIRWPSGTVQNLNNVEVNRRVRVTEENEAPETLWSTMP